MPIFDSSNKHFWVSNNSPQLDSCLSSSKVCLLKDKRICFKKMVSPKLDKRLKHKRNQHIQVSNGSNKIIHKN